MIRKYGPHMHIDVDACFGGRLFDRNLLGSLQSLIRDHAPRWSTKMRLWEPKPSAPHIDFGVASALFDAVKFDVTTISPFYKELVRQFGPPAHSGACGTLEFRGTDSSITIVMNVDDRQFLQFGDIWTWGNRIAFQLEGNQVEGINVSVFARRLLEGLCDRLKPWYARAESYDEFAAKNFSTAGGGVEAIGVDISRSLPGLYWLNYFGRECVQAMGDLAFTSSAAFETKRIGEGYLLALGQRASDWTSSSYRDTERRVMTSLGESFFFRRDLPGRPTKSPFVVER